MGGGTPPWLVAPGWVCEEWLLSQHCCHCVMFVYLFVCLQIYSTEHNGSNYSSNPSTPVSSPPPGKLGTVNTHRSQPQSTQSIHSTCIQTYQ